MLEKYLPLVDRVTTRHELSDLIAQMVSELSALHTFVYGGDMREGPDEIRTASLGALLSRDREAGGYRVDHIYRVDPDEPERRGPLSRPGVDVAEGDVIAMINGTPTLSVPDINALLRNQAGKQILLRVRSPGDDEPRDVVAEPISLGQARDLRYHEWEYERRLATEERGGGRIGYVHLRAMGGENYTEWAKGYYPVFNREGLIIDVRHNRGGNIDSWILGRLLRKIWFHWSQRASHPPVWNMQYAFRGHIAVLCNERTASDGEAFTEGFKRLGLGKVIGTRTWGGEIWLSSNNFLVDRGIATAGESGVYGPEGEWLIEGHGVDPDIVVDNLPHATFEGRDVQLEVAVDYLLRKIEEEPIEKWPVPNHPDLSFDYE
jgi:tricorn protease